MKKFISILAVAVLIFAVSSCDKKNKGPKLDPKNYVAGKVFEGETMIDGVKVFHTMTFQEQKFTGKMKGAKGVEGQDGYQSVEVDFFGSYTVQGNRLALTVERVVSLLVAYVDGKKQEVREEERPKKGEKGSVVEIVIDEQKGTLTWIDPEDQTTYVLRKK